MIAFLYPALFSISPPESIILCSKEPCNLFVTEAIYLTNSSTSLSKIESATGSESRYARLKIFTQNLVNINIAPLLKPSYTFVMGTIIYRTRQVMDSFTKSEKVIAMAVTEHPELVINSSITDFSKQINASTASVTRFCKKIGISGYAELRLELAKMPSREESESDEDETFDLQSVNGVNEIIPGIIDSTRSSVNILKTLITQEMIEEVVNLIIKSRRILIGGIGASGLVAQDLHQKLSRIGILSHYDTDQDLQKVQLVSFGEKDLVILFSYKGMTPHIKELAKIAKQKKAKVVAITRIGNSSVANLADIVLPVASSESELRKGATISRIEQLLIVDILYSSLIFYNKKNSMDYIVTTWDTLNRKEN